MNNILQEHNSYKILNGSSIHDLDLGEFSDRIKIELLIHNGDGTFDYNGDFEVDGKNLESLYEIPIKLKNVFGLFDCSWNLLNSLKGSPEFTKDYICSCNDLISLQYLPKEIDGELSCFGNNLISKKHLSKISGNKFSEAEFKYYKSKDGLIYDVKMMTKEQRNSELEFFRLYDKGAFKKIEKILKMIEKQEMKVNI